MAGIPDLSSIPNRDFYQILDIPRTADAEAIRKAYRRKALLMHPDKVGQDAASVERFQFLQRAYEVLSKLLMPEMSCSVWIWQLISLLLLGDEKKRKVYDQYVSAIRHSAILVTHHSS